MAEKLLLVTILNNLKKHDYSIADYKMCKREADVAIEALEMLIKATKFDGMSVPEIFNSLDKAIEEFDNAIH